MNSLRARLTLGVACVLGIAIGGLCAALYLGAARAAEKAARSRLDAVADLVATGVEWDEARLARDEDVLKRLEGVPGMAFEIRGPDGAPLAAGGAPGWPPDGFERAGGADTAESGGRAWRVARLSRLPLVENRPETAPILGVAVAVDVTDDRAAVARLGTLLAVLGPAVFLLGVFGVAAAVRRSLSPLKAMGDAAGSVSERNLAGRVPVPDTADELARLGASLNAALDRLERAFHRERGFIADASHELRTPVAIALTNLEVALSRPRRAEDYEEALKTQLETTRRMRDIVESLLTLARADAGRIPVRLEPLDLTSLLRDTLDHLGPVAAGRNIALRLETSSPVPVQGDAGLLRRLFDNLVANAIRYNRPGGSVRVEAAPGNGTVTARVRDSGPGIAAGHLPHLFERFYRVDEGRAREEGAPAGAGLGLAIAKWIAEAHGGAITVDSREGEGSTFTVSLRGAAPRE